MRSIGLGPHQREGVVKLNDGEVPASQRHQRMVALKPTRDGSSTADYSVVDLIDAARISFMLTPKRTGSFHTQVGEVLSTLQELLEQQGQPTVIVIQTVFLRNASDQDECEKLLAK